MSADVLVVDDSATVRADLQEAFEHEAFSVETAATMEAGVAALDRGRFGLVVLDVVLPDGDGLDLLRRIRSDSRTLMLPVMLLSTESEVASRIRGLSVGADEYVGKPYDRGYVVDRARQLIRARVSGPGMAPRRVVLLAEPSPTFRQALIDVLDRAGYEVVTAEGGHEVLRRVAALRPHLVIVNGATGDLDGPSTIQQIRLDPALRRIVCVMVLDGDDPGAELRALAAGADASVRKDEDFTLVLARLKAVDRAAEAAGTVASEPALMGPKRILIISPGDAGRDADSLRRDGNDVVIASSAPEALELLTAQQVDCIVLDLDLEGFSGIELMKVIRSAARWHDTPIVVRAEREDDPRVIDAVGSGADDCVTRSGGTALLAARLRAVLRRKQIDDEDRRVRDALVRKEAEAAEARLRAELAETRTALLDDLRRANAELTRANLALAAAKEKAEQESQFKSRFLAIMSHELRTPLNAILGFGQLLEQGLRGSLSDKQARHLTALVRNSRQLLALVNDILDLSKIQAGKMTLRLEPLDLRAELETAVQSVSQLARERDITLSLQVAPALPPLEADPFRLQQMLGNLLTNAVKFTPAGGRVALSARGERDEVVVTVEDTGIGIKREDLPRLFREFERLESGLVHRAEGTGIGLALTRHLTELHGGTIEVSSQPGVGSVFSLHLPTSASRQGTPTDTTPV
jgi:signal transduction histidine kinase/DNA-binding LytR/AlgR family response regulator